MKVPGANAKVVYTNTENDVHYANVTGGAVNFTFSLYDPQATGNPALPARLQEMFDWKRDKRLGDDHETNFNHNSAT